MSRSCLRVTSPAEPPTSRRPRPARRGSACKTGRTGHVSCPGHARLRVPFPRQSPYLCIVRFEDPDASATESNHALISDRLPDPAQFVRCYRILHTLAFCEGSHSSRQKVTDITRRTVYLIQSGRKPPVSCRFPDGSVPGRRSHVRSRPLLFEAGRGRERGTTSGWRRRKGRTTRCLSRSATCRLLEIIDWAPITFAQHDDRLRGSGMPGLATPRVPSIRRLFCVLATRPSAMRMDVVT